MQRAEALGANAIVGIDLDYETVGQGGSNAHGHLFWYCRSNIRDGCHKS